MKCIAPLLLAALVLCGCHSAKPRSAAVSAQVAAQAEPPAPPPLVRPAAFWPLAPGTRWTYAGTVIGATTNAVRVTSTVLEARTQRDHQIVRLSSFPPALSPWEAVPTNAPYVLLRTPAGAWHAIEAGQARHVLSRIADAKDQLDDLLTFETQVLAEPLKAGLRWGDPAGMQRLDGFYCWVTGVPHAEISTNIVGVSKDWKLDVFPIVFQTAPDRLDVQFAPNIGFLSADYAHHGTPGEVHLKLVEFHQPETKAVK